MTRTCAAQHAAASMWRAADRSAAVMPARHHRWARWPYSVGTVQSTIGSLPCLVCTQAWTHPVLILCGVMTHQALATS